MSAADSYARLRSLGLPVIDTRQAAARLGLTLSGASYLLRSLQKAGLVRRLRPGLWALGEDLEPFALAPYLTAPYPAYVSLWSALARHGMIEQIPRQVFVASTHRRQRIETTSGAYSIHHLAPELFDGYSGSVETGYLASPEKALFDTIYLRAPRGGHVFLPELSLPKRFDTEELDALTGRIARPRLRTIVADGIKDALSKAAES
jgi:predicted transcriptional regulator of viral defense system